MKIFRFVGTTMLLMAVLCSCETSDGGRKKKRTRPPLPGETESELSWARATRPTDVPSAFGLPNSR